MKPLTLVAIVAGGAAALYFLPRFLPRAKAVDTAEPARRRNLAGYTVGELLQFPERFSKKYHEVARSFQKDSINAANTEKIP